MQIRSLENISTSNILNCFNKAFADYVLPFQLTEEQFNRKVLTERIKFKQSVGAFDGDVLSGFILQGIYYVDGIKIVYNAGTGVVPESRGQQLTKKMYASIFKEFQQIQPSKYVLEVIIGNNRAYNTYADIGFKIERELLSFKGKVKSASKNSEIQLKEIPFLNWTELQKFWDWKPSWQNSIQALQITGKGNINMGAYLDNELVGYTSWNASTNRINQFAVSKRHRRRGIGSMLFENIQKGIDAPCVIINVDQSDENSILFLKKLGLETFISQYEMGLEAKSQF